MWTDKLPLSIREHPDWKLWGRIWYDVHYGETMKTLVFCGARGSGKSWSLGYLSEMLDRDENDICRFNMDRMCFSPSKFSGWMARTDLPKGSVVCLDDAGLVLYNKESLKKIVVLLGKMFQEVRYKNRIILMSLPYFKILESHSRMFSDIYIEIVGRDNKKGENLGKIQKLMGDYYSGEIYRYNILKREEVIHPKFNMPIFRNTMDYFRFPKPSVRWQHNYERTKAEYLDWWNEHTHEEITGLEKKEISSVRKLHRMDLSEAFKIVEADVGAYWNTKGRVDANRILQKFVDAQGNPKITMDTAKRIASILNTKTN